MLSKAFFQIYEINVYLSVPPYTVLNDILERENVVYASYSWSKACLLFPSDGVDGIAYKYNLINSFRLSTFSTYLVLHQFAHSVKVPHRKDEKRPISLQFCKVNKTSSESIIKIIIIIIIIKFI